MNPLPASNEQPDKRYFIFTQASDSEYQDQEGTAYHYPLTIANARKIRPGDAFVYYRPGATEEDRYFFGYGQIDQVVPGSNNDATALVTNYVSFSYPVPRLALGSDLRRSAQQSISLIDQQVFDKLVQLGTAQQAPQDWLYVLTASGPSARAHYAETIAKPVDQLLLQQHLPNELLKRLDVSNVRAWGALPGPRNIVTWHQMKEGDWVVTYWSREYHDSTRVVAKLENEALAEALWGRDAGGDTWRFMYLLEPPKPLPIEAAKATEWLPSSYQGFTRISTPRIHKIAGRFGSVRQFIESRLGTDTISEARPKLYLTFEEQVERVHEYMENHGYIVDGRDLANFVTCLRVKPFVILAGVSGIGKSRLVRRFSEAIGARCEVIPVQPNWTDNSDLFGYIDPITGKLVPGRCTTALREAEALGSKPFLLCLDEMNLAHVEYYFADFLSVLESRQLDETDRIVSDDLLGNLRSQLALKKDSVEDSWPKLQFPNNAFVVGTVNMDETTHPFSRKVLDRANTIELTAITLERVSAGKPVRFETHFDWEFLLPSAVTLGDIYEEDPPFFDSLIAEISGLNLVLEPLNQHFAYRVRDEICLYCYFAKDLPRYLPPDVAMDYQISQKILPRIHGSTEATRRALIGLYKKLVPASDAARPEGFDLTAALDDARAARCPRSAKKLALMLERFQTDGFTSFWL